MITIWPQYMDKNLSLKEGRKISQEDAVKEPWADAYHGPIKEM